VSHDETLAWLADLQARFGTMLRTPLDRASGTLRAPTDGYDAALCDDLLPGPHGDARARLAVYHRQYWFRLFTVLQGEYPLTARLLGMWTFNELAARYLAAHPPSHVDVQRVAHALVPYLTETLAGASTYAAVPSAALVEAATLDAAFARVFLAPEVTPLDAAALATRGGDARLSLAPTVALYVEHWPLVALRRRALDEPGEQALSLGPRLAAPQHWAIFRTERGHGVAPLEPLAHRLFTLLAERPLADALGVLESDCTEAARSRLPGRVQAWLAQSMRLGFWCA